MNSQLAPILSVGDLVADLIVSIPSLPAQAGQHQLAQDIRLEPGGGANFLIAGARLGYPMTAIGVLGDDDRGQQVAELMQAEGVNLAGVRHAGTTTQVIVLVSQTGEHVFLGKYGQGSKIEAGQAEQRLIEQSGAIFCAGYTLRETRLVDLTLETLRQGKQRGIPLFFDPGPHLKDVSLEIKQAVLALVDTILVTEAELPLLTSATIPELLRHGPSHVVVKRGAAGCAIWSAVHPADEPLLESPGYPVPVVDTSAAGDSFDAAFIVATLWGWPLADCARLANAVGAAKVQKLGGGRNVPTLAEVRQVISRFRLDLKI